MPTASSVTSGKLIRWTNTADSVRYFDVYRRSDSVMTSITTGNIVAKVAFGSNHYVDLVGTTAYWYWIKAISWAGKSSSFSDTVTAVATNIVLGNLTSDISIVGNDIKIGTACSTVTIEGKIISLNTSGTVSITTITPLITAVSGSLTLGCATGVTTILGKTTYITGQTAGTAGVTAKTSKIFFGDIVPTADMTKGDLFVDIS